MAGILRVPMTDYVRGQAVVDLCGRPLFIRNQAYIAPLNNGRGFVVPCQPRPHLPCRGWGDFVGGKR